MSSTERGFSAPKTVGKMRRAERIEPTDWESKKRLSYCVAGNGMGATVAGQPQKPR
jgi:hypothetical protein